MADLVRIDYDEVKQITQRFFDQGDILKQSWDRVNGQVDVLQNGAWTGQNADTFFTEMDEILRALDRLAQLMGQCGDAMEHISKEFKSAEEEAGSLFN
jgi:WXG100 family type VII secretion target